MKYKKFEVKISVKMANQHSHLFTSNFHISLVAGPYYVISKMLFVLKFLFGIVPCSFYVSLIYASKSLKKTTQNGIYKYLVVCDSC